MYSIIITLISRHVIYTRSVLCYYVRDWGGVSARTDVAGSLRPIIAIRSSILDPRGRRAGTMKTTVLACSLFVPLVSSFAPPPQREAPRPSSVRSDEHIFYPSEHSYLRRRYVHLHMASNGGADNSLTDATDITTNCHKQKFDLATALFCGGLAFDAYAEPPQNSTRWERGSKGLSVAFISPSFTRNLYKGLVQITPKKCIDLPDEDSAAESIMTGGGVDAYLLIGVVEGKWKEDLLELRDKNNNGVLDLKGCAHVGRSSTAWSNVNERQARRNKAEGKSGSYHIQSSWGKGGQAIWDQEPFYLYVQDPSEATLVLSIVDDDIVGDGDVIGSATRKLTDLIPSVAEGDPMAAMKQAVLDKIQSSHMDPGGLESLTGKSLAEAMSQNWEGDIKLQTKPKKKDKGGQTAGAVVVGGMVGGPMGAAVGAAAAQFYEGEVRGKISLGIRYLPIPDVDMTRESYEAKGSLDGVFWNDLYRRFAEDKKKESLSDDLDFHLVDDDLEFCFFVNHDITGCSCALYRSLSKRFIVISFRGTTVPKDIVTDASIVQDTWVEGVDPKKEGIPKVHAGFRTSLNSISRRLKELVLAAVDPGEDLSQYDVLVTGHSLGGALATLFMADVAEYGMDAGRGLPQSDPSEPWWNTLTSAFFEEGKEQPLVEGPPRPKSLRMYNFGSPRVGNNEFVALFESLMEDGKIDEAYRVVNGEDLVARMPRTINAVVGEVRYDHCGPTVVIEAPKFNSKDDGSKIVSPPVLWIEGESKEEDCPVNAVRDGEAISSPLASGALLGDIVSSIKAVTDDTGSADERDAEKSFIGKVLKLGDIAERVTGRLMEVSVDDLASMVGIDKKYTAREIEIVKSIFSGDGLSHHLEPQYFKAMGMACGYLALAGQELRTLESLEGLALDDIVDVELEIKNEEAQKIEALAERQEKLSGKTVTEDEEKELDTEVWNALARVLAEERSKKDNNA